MDIREQKHLHSRNFTILQIVRGTRRIYPIVDTVYHTTMIRLSLLPLLCLAAFPAELLVKVTGFPRNQGQIGCALYAGPDGFPMEPAKAQAQRHPTTSATVLCRFENLKPGLYAVAVSADLNSNGKTDKNFLGMPTEPWGVSRNARPRLRAPRFEEASIKVEDGPALTIEIEVAK